MFKYNKKISKTSIKTDFGSICIHDVVFSPFDIENALTELIFSDENIQHMFAENNLSVFNRKNIYKRFIPKNESNEIDLKYVEKELNNKKTSTRF